VLDASFTSDAIAEMGLPLGMGMPEPDFDALLGDDGNMLIEGEGEGDVDDL